ncbi:hypothetical protein P8452_28995 [Trifolium repens]|nr:DnaJ/Hsp40 cysteine-rich domain superfamily protein [Trifolium repens]WJX41676.1 hypothetical protein P8452_28995 [Trifolium repens]
MAGSACASSCCGSALIPKSPHSKIFFISPTPIAVIVGGNNNNRISRLCVRGSMVDSSSSSDFIKRMEQTWLISQQPRPVVCSSCSSKGHIECKWCRGTGFFVLGDNMLCEVPSRNTSCIICTGKGSTCCSNCQGTGFRAKWLEQPPTS